MQKKTSCNKETKSIYGREVRLHQHLAELCQLLRATYFLCEQRKLYDVEEFIVELVGFREVLLLHLMSDATVFTIGCCDGQMWC
jgi:hypothetical protein